MEISPKHKLIIAPTSATALPAVSGEAKIKATILLRKSILERPSGPMRGHQTEIRRG